MIQYVEPTILGGTATQPGQQQQQQQQHQEHVQSGHQASEA